MVDLIGKDGRIRTVPMSIWAKAAIDDRTAAAGVAERFVLPRCHQRAARLAAGPMTAQALYYIVAG